MTAFDEQLLRLKQSLGLTQDKDVAALLGLTKAGLSVRKKRGVFPDDRVRKLAEDRPELRLDVRYVLTGESTEFLAQLGLLREATKVHSGDASKRDALAQTLMDRVTNDREAAFLDDFRRCSPSDQDVLQRMARTMARGEAS